MKWLKWLLLLQILVNLIGALGPELGFDALWYHLTEAKLFLANHSIAPISGNLLYWSGLPRLGEIIYMFLPGKLVHWGFGVLGAYLIYRLSGVAAALLFYSLILVGWLSTSAYVDLMAAAFLLAAVYFKNLKRILFIILAAAVKLQGLALGMAITLIPWGILGILPFMLVNWHFTGNPVYPFGENFGLGGDWFFNGFWFWLSRPFRLFFDPAFRVGPIILIVFLLQPKFNRLLILSFLIWWLFPGTDFGRFALFPLALLAVNIAKKPSKLMIGLIIFQAVIGVTWRAYANKKYLPVIFKQQTQADFLAQNLKFDFGDFYDIDGWFKTNLKSTDKVLVYDIHNLYYLDFPFDHETWKNSKIHYTHILVGNNGPEFNLPLLYENPTTKVKLYLNDQQNQ